MTLPAKTVITSLITLLSEAYEGPLDGFPNRFISNEPGSGLFGTLNGLSAEEASLSFGGGDVKGSTIASHTEHLRWSLALSNALIRGDKPDGDWEKSWSVTTVSTAEWSDLREALRSEFEALRRSMQCTISLPEEYMIGGIAIVAHAAYHLGAIRSLVRLVPQ